MGQRRSCMYIASHLDDILSSKRGFLLDDMVVLTTDIALVALSCLQLVQFAGRQKDRPYVESEHLRRYTARLQYLKLTITSLRWNLRYQDLFVVTFGSYDFLKQGTSFIAYLPLCSRNISTSSLF